MDKALEAGAPVTLFYSYAHEDEPLRDELQGHLKILERRGLLAPWHDRQILPGQDWSGQIDAHLQSAELVLLLVSKDFIDSDYIMGVELAAAMKRHDQQAATVVPILVRAVDLDAEDAEDMPFLKLQGLPTDLKPVTSWPNRDEAWTNVAKGLRGTVKSIRERRPPVPPALGARILPAPAVAAPAPAPDFMFDCMSTDFDTASESRGGGGIDSLIVSAGVMSEAPEPLRHGDSQRSDPVLENLVAEVAQQIDQARRARRQAPLSAIGIKALEAGTRVLIDLPDQKRVLWVDDQPNSNRFEVAALAKLQIEVLTAPSTDEALRAIEHDQEGFDLVISDWERAGEGAAADIEHAPTTVV